MEINNYRITGRKIGKRGGAFQGIAINDDGSREPIFGGANLIHALIWWNTTREKVQAICDGYKERFPEYEFVPEKV